MWIRRFHQGEDASSRLVCFPHAGGSASYFYPIASQLRPDVEVLAVQYPGHEERHAEPAIGDLGRLADELAIELRPYLREDTVFLGHSMGAIVAFEVALRLERDCETGPAALIASGQAAPSRRQDGSVHLRDDAGLIGELQRLGGTGSALFQDSQLCRQLLPAIRNDYRAIETYRCSPSAMLSCPITVFTGAADPEVSIAEAWAWERHSSADVEVQVFPGGHFFLADQRDGVTDSLRQLVKSNRRKVNL